LTEERGFFLVALNDCTAAYPPLWAFVCWLLRRVGGSAVFAEVFFFYFFVNT
jgi:hypothetical protein